MSKGSEPRNCFSKEFKDNFVEILKDEVCQKCGKSFQIRLGDKSVVCQNCENGCCGGGCGCHGK